MQVASKRQTTSGKPALKTECFVNFDASKNKQEIKRK